MKRSHPFLTQSVQPTRKREKFQFDVTIKTLTDVKSSGEYYLKWKRGNKHMGRTNKMAVNENKVEWETSMSFVSSLFLSSNGKKFKKKYMYIKIYRNDEKKSCGSTNINLGSLIKSMDAETQNIMLQYKIKGKLKANLIIAAKVTYIKRSNNTFTDPTTMTDATDMSLDDDDEDDEPMGELSIDSSHVKNATITPVHTPTSPKIAIPAGPDVGSPKIFSPSSQKNSARMRALLRMRGNKARRAYNASISFEEDDNAFQSLSQRLKEAPRSFGQSPLMATPTQKSPVKTSSDESPLSQNGGTPARKLNMDSDETQDDLEDTPPLASQSNRANLNKLLLKKRKQVELANTQKQFVEDVIKKCPHTSENEILIMSSLIVRAFSHWELFDRDNGNIGDLLIETIENEIANTTSIKDLLFWFSMIRQMLTILETEFQIQLNINVKLNEELVNVDDPSIAVPLSAKGLLFQEETQHDNMESLRELVQKQLVKQEKDASFSLYQSPLNAFTTKLANLSLVSYFKLIHVACKPFAEQLQNFLFVDNMSLAEDAYQISTLVAYFSEIYSHCESNLMDRHATNMIIHQLFYRVASVVLTNLFQENSPYCCMKSAIYLKMNLTQLELWGESNSLSEPLAQFRLIRDALNVLMMNKSIVATDYESICPLLNTTQMHQLFDFYSPDEFDPDGIPSGVLSMLPKRNRKDGMYPPYHTQLVFQPSMKNRQSISSFWKSTTSPFGQTYPFLL